MILELSSLSEHGRILKKEFFVVTTLTPHLTSSIHKFRISTYLPFSSISIFSIHSSPGLLPSLSFKNSSKNSNTNPTTWINKSPKQKDILSINPNISSKRASNYCYKGFLYKLRTKYRFGSPSSRSKSGLVLTEIIIYDRD